MNEIKITAVAANEGPYLPQWIYHHHYFGFKAFDIYVNNTTDNSLEILKKLQDYFTCINIQNIDWIETFFRDNLPFCAIQNLSYLMNYYNSSDYDYILYMDIDEFWMPYNCTDSIQDCIKNFNYPDCVLFNWLFLEGTNEFINPLLAHKYLYGRMWGTFKSLLKSKLNPRGMKIHYPYVENMGRIVTGDGEPHKFNRNEIFALDVNQRKWPKKYFIIHDGSRTFINYLSKIIRGHISKRNQKDPDKRLAYDRPDHKLMSAHAEIRFENVLPNAYHHGYMKMVNDLDLYADLRRAKIHELLKALECLRHLHINNALPIARHLAATKKPLPELHEMIFEQLCAYAPEYRTYASAKLCDSDKLVKANKEETIKAFNLAIGLYPFAKDESGAPLFLKKLIQHLADLGEFEAALNILADSRLSVSKLPSSDWALPILAKAYEKHQRYDDAFSINQRMVYTYDKNIYAALDRLSKQRNSIQ